MVGMALRNWILSGVGLVVTLATWPRAIAFALDDRVICGNYVIEPLGIWAFAMLVICAAWSRHQPSP